jgi:hypothetical protein
MSEFTNAARNESTEILVKWNAERFVIIGDARKVNNKTLNRLIAGEFPKGWVKAPATFAEMMASV